MGSMSRAGNPYDNAYVESFMKTLKREEVHLLCHRTMGGPADGYLEDTYNTTRLNTALGYLPPVD